MADDRGEPGALTPLRDPDMPADIDAAANIDASSVNAEASVDSPGDTLRASADRLAEPSRATEPSDTLEIQPSVAATSVSFASPSRLVTTSYAESGQGALSPSDTVFSADATSPSDTVYTPERATSPDTVFTESPDRAKSPDTVYTETPEKKDDDTLHDSWTEPSLPPENDDKRPSSRDKVRNVVRSGLIKGGSSPTHDQDADDLAAQAAERALTRVDDAVEAKERGKKEREEKVIQAERAAERGRTKTQKAARRYFMFRSRSRSASPGWKPPQLMRTKNSTSLARGDMSPEKKPAKKSSSWFGNKKTKPKKKKELFGSPPKKKGFMSRMQENFAVLKENDTVVVVQQWDGVEINVDVLKPCKVAVLRQKVRQFIAKRDDIMPEVEKHEHLRHRYVLLFQGQMLQDEDTVPKGVYGEVKDDEWPNKVYVARSKYRPPFEESEIDVDSLPSEWSIGTGSVSIKPLEYEEPEEEKDDDAEEALRRSMESQRRSQEMSARRRGKATKNKSVASKMHPHSASFDLRRELKLLRCPPHIVERLCSYGYDDRGSFAALTEDVLQSAPLYVDRKTRRKIVALAEIYRQQDLRDEAAPTNYLAKRSIEEKQDAKAFQTGDEEFFGADSA